MKKLVSFMSVTAIIILALVLVASTVVIGVCVADSKAAADQNAAAAIVAAQRNSFALLDLPQAKRAYNQLLADDWEGFQKTFGIISTHYLTGDTIVVSLMSDNFDEEILLTGAKTTCDVETVAIKSAGMQVEPFDTNEGCTVTIHIDDNQAINMTPTSVAFLCQTMSRITE